jgi:hypothetical protein
MTTTSESFNKCITEGYSFKGLDTLIGVAVLNDEPQSDTIVNLSLKMLNRHGLIAGATGTGKTKTLQLVAEQLSRNGIPTVLMDLKGDLGGLAVPGEKNEIVEARKKLFNGAYEYKHEGFPVNILSIGEEEGISIKGTIQEFGPVLLSKILGLNSVQSGIISIAFKYCEDKNLQLSTIADLKFFLNKICDENKDIQDNYGNIAGTSVTTILRNIAELEQQGGNYFIGAPSLNIKDLLLKDEKDRGYISIIRLTQLQDKPALFSTFIIYLLSKLYSSLPEVGDQEKPNLVMFIDEAHLLFNNSNKIIQDKIESVIKLIRSKGVGIIFCTQTPADISENVLGQLGLKIQHALRAFTAKDRKAIKMMAENFPETVYYNVEEELTTLGIGQAFITGLKEDGTPTPLVKVILAPPVSRMAILTSSELSSCVQASPLIKKYTTNKKFNTTPSPELEQFYNKIQLLKQKQEQQEAAASIQQKQIAKKPVLPRRQSLNTMMFNAMMPLAGMFSNNMPGNTPVQQSQSTQYYYTKEGMKKGPFNEFEISNYIINGEINRYTYLWKTGMSDWLLVSNFQEFLNLIK